VTACLTICLTALCAALTWDPVPDADVSLYRVRDAAGVVVAEAPCCYAEPPEPFSTSYSIVAVDTSGNESPNPLVVPWVDCGEWGDGGCMVVGPCGRECTTCVEWDGPRCLRREPVPGVDCCRQPVCCEHGVKEVEP